MTNSLELSPWDEYFNHQIALPHQVVASSDPGWRERYWISIHDIKRRDFVLSTGYGKYPNRDVMDGFCIAARGGVQRNLRVSRQLSPRHGDIAVGPLALQIIEPLKKIRFLLGENPTGITYDLTWHSSVAPALEGRHFEVNRGRITHELVRYVQTGKLTGELVFEGERLEVAPDCWWGVRDHSWGIRPMSPVPGDPPLASVQWNFLAFCPIQFPSFSIHIYLFESQPGRPTHLSATIMRPEGAGDHDDEIRAITHDLQWENDAPIPTLTGGRISVDYFSGKLTQIDVRACSGRAYLRGGGYGSTQGKWLGENHSETDCYDLHDTEHLRTYNSHSSDHLIEAHCDGETGFGVIEYMIRRGYTKYANAYRRSRT